MQDSGNNNIKILKETLANKERLPSLEVLRRIRGIVFFDESVNTDA